MNTSKATLARWRAFEQDVTAMRMRVTLPHAAQQPLLLDEAAQLRWMAAMARRDGREDLAHRMEAMAAEDERKAAD